MQIHIDAICHEKCMKNVSPNPCKKVGILQRKSTRFMQNINSGFQDVVSYESGLFLVVLKICLRRAHPMLVVVKCIWGSEIEKFFELFFESRISADF